MAAPIVRPHEQRERRPSTEASTRQDGHEIWLTGDSSGPESPSFTQNSSKHEPHVAAESTTIPQSARKPRIAPWFHLPMTTVEAEAVMREHHSGSGWFREDQQASEWLNLFYDLAVVAVLSVFSAKHELSSAKVLPNFVSYYLLIVWLWTSQTHYDVHYQAEDSFHRLTKYIQVVLFLYVGAASSQWNLGKIRDYSDTPGIASSVVSEHQSSAESFVTVSVALAVSRLLLAIQYGVSAYIGRRQGRRVSHQVHTSIASIASMILTIIAVAIPSKTYAGVVLRIFFLYSSLAVEMLIHIVHIWFTDRDGRRVDVEYLGRRWGAFTLVILGEGLTGLTRAFSSAIDGLSTNSAVVYGQVVLAVLIVVLLYSILFNRFRPDEQISPRRFVWWEVLHFGLHFGILLLLAAITNYIIVLAFADGILDAFYKFDEIVQASIAGKDPAGWNHTRLVGFVDRLGIEPPLVEEVRLLTDLRRNSSDTYIGILAVQYFTQIVFAALFQYNIDMSDHTAYLFLEVISANATMVSNTTLQSERQNEVIDNLSLILNATVEEEYGGTIWLFPTAGGILIMSAIRSLLWTTQTTSYNFHHVTSRLVHLVPLIVGTVLALLGMLAIGSKDYDFRTDGFRNPYYKLLDANLPLAVVLIAYVLCYLGAETGLWWIARRKKRRQKPTVASKEAKETRMD